MDNVSIRKFLKKDVKNKVKWINDNDNNTFLHYDLPLDFDKTLDWYQKNKKNKNRYDMVIEYNNIPVGVIGIINIDKKKGEYYITLGEKEYKRKGISFIASKLLLDYAFNDLKLEKIWLCVDEKNIAARKLYEKIGFRLEGLLIKDIYFKNEMINRCMYGLCRNEWMKK